MRKIKIVSLLCVLLGGNFCFNVFAGDVAIAHRVDSRSKEVRKLIIDVTVSKIIGRELSNSNSDSNKLSGGDEEYVRLSYAYSDSFQPYLKAGSSYLEQESKNEDISGMGKRDLEYEYDRGLGYGGGVCGIIPLKDSLFFGYDGQYVISGHDIKNIVHSGEDAAQEEGKIRFKDWHTALYLANDFDISRNLIITPYAGLRYSKADLDIKKNIRYVVSEGAVESTGTTESENNLGIFAGIDSSFYDKFNLGVQGRFLDETAVSLTGKVKF